MCVRILWAVLGLCGCAEGLAPPADTPPAETPPAETPPAETPPAETGEETGLSCVENSILRGRVRIIADPVTGAANAVNPVWRPLRGACLRSLRVEDWGDATALTVEVVPGHITTLVPGADQAGYPPDLVEMAAVRWWVHGGRSRAPTVMMLGMIPGKNN